ncbi:MAG: heme exporter protein CcmD [Phenylobacterium sp.]|uniref:heme exporter protein CcmD n=1 Tax=Phenylobacterium sp. TaxID=1871053 RepID=UPI002720D384|nr:heme exporter protein CcmD [Phenylobacterium sp.]MDO8411954.1 heme exporter protein CcmD [Phenylobacterium sp.]|tara:strand:+ start:3251 stop:3454 length:204 start_codon:yes stop_codon:yes gene_type:complete
MSDYFAMGGYAGFVWSAYAIVVVAVAALIGATWRDIRRQRALLAALEGAETSGARKRAPARASGAAK